MRFKKEFDLPYFLGWKGQLNVKSKKRIKFGRLTKFLWLKRDAPPSAFRTVPPGGMCISAFAFVSKDEKFDQLLLGKYRVVPEWETLTGIDPERLNRHSKGLTIPASHLKFGEDPRDAGRRIVEEILGIKRGRYLISEPRAESERWGDSTEIDDDHWDISFFFNVLLNENTRLGVPTWYEVLAFRDLGEVREEEFARKHQDVLRRWRKVKDEMGPVAS